MRPLSGRMEEVKRNYDLLDARRSHGSRRTATQIKEARILHIFSCIGMALLV
jgi:hypothetical protein